MLETALTQQAVTGALQQAILDLTRITGQVANGPAGWPSLGRQLDSLGRELAQAAAWLREELKAEPAPPTATRPAQEQVAALQAEYPGHHITIEDWPDRRDRYVARAITPGARPWLCITPSLDELEVELLRPVGGGPAIRSAAPADQGWVSGTSGGTPGAV